MLPFFETLDTLRGLVDFGLFVLIWMVQLIIYPWFEFTERERFKVWHYRYTGLISIFVAPLMLSQTAIYLWSSASAQRWHDFTGLALIAVVWIATLVLSVPCHDRLQAHEYDLRIIRRLVRTNWVRTAAWTCMLTIDIGVGIIIR